MKRVNSSAGLTLVETIVACAVIGILAAIAAPNWFRFNNEQNLNRTISEIDSNLRLAQTRARQESLFYSVVFRMNGNIPQMATFRNSFSAGINCGNRPTTLNWVNLASRPNFITVTTPTSPNTRDCISFGEDGSIPVNTTLSPLRTTDRITVSMTGISGNPRRCVIIQTLLGSTTIERNDRCT